MKRLLLLILLGVVGGLGWLALAPGPIEPQAWTPGAAPPLEGPYARNERLKTIEKLAQGFGDGPEG
ncbi:MAG TPA: hypothetical protein VLI06_11975, partial [Solimonas sp.]|nr:hypothetical protein [Solimonas sp.]